jgi:hypothetical protein
VSRIEGMQEESNGAGDCSLLHGNNNLCGLQEKIYTLIIMLPDQIQFLYILPGSEAKTDK